MTGKQCKKRKNKKWKVCEEGKRISGNKEKTRQCRHRKENEKALGAGSSAKKGTGRKARLGWGAA